MWAPALRAGRSRIRQQTILGRRFNGSGNTNYPTYFQQPPPPPPKRRVFRFVSGFLFMTTGAFLGAYAYSRLIAVPVLEALEAMNDEAAQAFRDPGFLADVNDLSQRHQEITQVIPMDLYVAQSMLERKRGVSTSDSTISHFASLPSNSPCEDTLAAGSAVMSGQPWHAWAVFDGHAGPRTSHQLAESCIPHLLEALGAAHCGNRLYDPNDQYTANIIKKAFVSLDNLICSPAPAYISMKSELSAQAGYSRSMIIDVASLAFAGSCALLSLFDEKQGILRVACTGDSRAVLGRWDESQKRYVAKIMSEDQTGFNQKEVERLDREHPGENVIDPKTGRIFGLAVTRAFGDTRWKWPEEVTKRAYELFWGPGPRPNIKTPPYLTAEPEVTEVKVEEGKHPDFLIMASDGLWDNMSSEDAVTCVQKWLDEFQPADLCAEMEVGNDGEPLGRLGTVPGISRKLEKNLATSSVASASDMNDTYWNAEEKALKWRVSPEHFIVEDNSAAVHLIKNALGGNRRDLYTSIMSVQYPLSRNVRDDITVSVVFFGRDTKKEVAAAVKDAERFLKAGRS